MKQLTIIDLVFLGAVANQEKFHKEEADFEADCMFVMITSNLSLLPYRLIVQVL